jgi:hypothetical protein
LASEAFGDAGIDGVVHVKTVWREQRLDASG